LLCLFLFRNAKSAALRSFLIGLLPVIFLLCILSPHRLGGQREHNCAGGLIVSFPPLSFLPGISVSLTENASIATGDSREGCDFFFVFVQFRFSHSCYCLFRCALLTEAPLLTPPVRPLYSASSFVASAPLVWEGSLSPLRNSILTLCIKGLCPSKFVPWVTGVFGLDRIRSRWHLVSCFPRFPCFFSEIS